MCLRDQDDGRVGGHLAEVRPVVPPQGGPHPQPPVVGPLEGHRVARVQAERVSAHGEDVETGSVPAEPRDLRQQRKLRLPPDRHTYRRTDRQTDRQTEESLSSSGFIGSFFHAPLLLLLLLHLLSVCLSA